jgi:hypothetical protein
MRDAIVESRRLRVQSCNSEARIFGVEKGSQDSSLLVARDLYYHLPNVDR